MSTQRPPEEPSGVSPDAPAPPSESPTNEAPPSGPAAKRPDECPLCGAAMYGVHCKLICPNCGYREDCSDLFPRQSP